MRIVLTGNTSFKIANFRAGLISALHEDGHELIVVSPPDDYTEILQQMGCTTIALRMDRNGTNPLSEAMLMTAIYRQLAQLRPDYVFGYTIKNNIYAGMACRRLGIPFAPNVTGLGPAFNRRGLLNKVVRRLYLSAFRDAQMVFFQNKEDRQTFLEVGLVAPEFTRLLPGSGVDLERFKEMPLPSSPPVRFLLIARMLRDKGVCQFADAAAQVRAEHPEAEFQLLGPLDHAAKSRIEMAEIDAWQSAGVLSYLGATTDVRPYIERADCVVLPSYYREGTPRSLLEAAAMGRPLITTNMPGCQDTLLDGVSGYLVRPQDSEDLAGAFKRFLALSPGDRQGMGKAGRALMEAQFSECIVIEAYRELLRDSCAGSSRTTA